jgi:hypothetical protein
MLDTVWFRCPLPTKEDVAERLHKALPGHHPLTRLGWARRGRPVVGEVDSASRTS